MTNETFAKAAELNAEIEDLKAKLKDLLLLKQNRDNGYNVHLHLFDDVGTEVSINDRDVVEPIIETLIERTEQSVDELTQEFNKL